MKTRCRSYRTSNQVPPLPTLKHLPKPFQCMLFAPTRLGQVIPKIDTKQPPMSWFSIHVLRGVWKMWSPIDKPSSAEQEERRDECGASENGGLHCGDFASYLDQIQLVLFGHCGHREELSTPHQAPLSLCHFDFMALAFIPIHHRREKQKREPSDIVTVVTAVSGVSEAGVSGDTVTVVMLLWCVW
ncbi:hypothetical protein STEG23_016539 [Scotinomys teguina]